MIRKGETLWVFFASFLLFIVHIHGIDIYSFDEARNAFCAREMQNAGNLIVPIFNGDLRDLKPPLHYWFMILGYEIFGYGGLGARIFSGLFGALTVVSVYVFGCRHWGRMVALGSVGILLSSIHLSVQVHQSVPDPYLLFFMTAGSLLLYAGWREESARLHIWAYLSLGLGILCKGPIALLLPGFGVFLFLLGTRNFRWKEIVKFHPFWGVLLSAAVAIPWFVAVHHMTEGAFTEGFFMKHNLRRFSEPLEGHGGIFLVTLAYVLVGMMPFGWALFAAVPRWIKDRKRLPPNMLFVLSQAFAIVFFFSVSGTKLINYTVPSYPFIALALSIYFTDRIKEDKYFAIQLILWIGLILGLSITLGAAYFLSTDPSYYAPIGTKYWVFAVLPFSALLGLYFWRKRKGAKALISIGVGHALVGILFFLWINPRLDDMNPVRVLEAHVENPKTQEVIAYQHFNPAFLSIWDRQIRDFWYAKNIDQYMRGKHGPVYVVTQERSLDDLVLKHRMDTLGMHPDLFERQESVILKVYPDEK